MPNNTTTAFQSSILTMLQYLILTLGGGLVLMERCSRSQSQSLPLYGSCHKHCTFIYSRAKSKEGNEVKCH